MKELAKLFISLLAVCLGGVIMGLPLKLLWNEILVDALGVGIITYWGAVGIYIICAVLFRDMDRFSEKLDEEFEDF